jgi:predicted 2-oxoglutarate/Fe(II)-dependent dioxygenase YbiX
MNLNEDYEGGDVVFGNQNLQEIKRVQLKRGSLLAFPSNFLYPHMIEPITKGIRYSIVAWLS